MSKKAMTLALEALEDISQMQNHSNSGDSSDVDKAIKALEEALAKQEQGEPVGVVNFADADSWYFLPLVPLSELPEGTKFYTTPQPAQKQAQGEPSYAERLLAHVEDFAKRCGWSKESGEGAFECVQRTSYAQGVEDGKLQRSQEQRSVSEQLGEPVGEMTPRRAEMFMSRFKHEEKMLGPNEQKALDYVIDILVAKQEQGEPVAEVRDAYDCQGLRWFTKYPLPTGTPLYTTPQPAQKPWVGLTDEEVADLGRHELWIKQFIRTIEAKLKEKNGL